MLQVLHINNKSEHEQALKIIELLIEDYDKNQFLIDLLCVSIEKYENTAHEFAEFNKRQADINRTQFFL
jgi:HTH-type transcriptional regulator/antitoxin HigA